jgi:hypothetical protein
MAARCRMCTVLLSSTARTLGSWFEFHLGCGCVCSLCVFAVLYRGLAAGLFPVQEDPSVFYEQDSETQKTRGHGSDWSVAVCSAIQKDDVQSEIPLQKESSCKYIE